ncbi:MAG: tetratricopeptide repeat protein [Elusimicrobiota bacterium]
MKYRSCGLILCLSSIAFFTLVYAEEQPKTGTAAIKELPSKELSSDQKNSNYQDTLEILKKLTEQYKFLSTKIDILATNYKSLCEDFSVIVSSFTDLSYQENTTRSLVALSESYTNLNSRIAKLSKKVDELSYAQSDSRNKELESSGEKNDGESDDKKSKYVARKSGPISQYVKIKSKDDGREIELCLDPAYVDMNIDFTRKTPNTTTRQEETKDVEDIVSDVVKSVERSLQEKLPKKQQETTNQQAIGKLHKAQKLYYAKKYNAAMDAVQLSLENQETAVGYALKGSLYFTLGDVDSAIICWESALQLDPTMEEVKTAIYKFKRR